MGQEWVVMWAVDSWWGDKTFPSCTLHFSVLLKHGVLNISLNSPSPLCVGMGLGFLGNSEDAVFHQETLSTSLNIFHCHPNNVFSWQSLEYTVHAIEYANNMVCPTRCLSITQVSLLGTHAWEGTLIRKFVYASKVFGRFYRVNVIDSFQYHLALL